jgi:peptide deformylase
LTNQTIIQVSRSGGTSESDHILRQRAAEIESIGSETQLLVEDLLRVMNAHPICVGLAAPQLGVLKRVAVADVGRDQSLVLINPEILATSGKRDKKRESCMSVWGLTGVVERREKVSIRYQDLTGRWHEENFRSFPARVICHEIDHLNGVLYTALVEGPLEATDLFAGKSP